MNITRISQTVSLLIVGIGLVVAVGGCGQATPYSGKYESHYTQSKAYSAYFAEIHGNTLTVTQLTYAAEPGKVVHSGKITKATAGKGGDYDLEGTAEVFAGQKRLQTVSFTCNYRKGLLNTDYIDYLPQGQDGISLNRVKKPGMQTAAVGNTKSSSTGYKTAKMLLAEHVEALHGAKAECTIDSGFSGGAYQVTVFVEGKSYSYVAEVDENAQKITSWELKGVH